MSSAERSSLLLSLVASVFEKEKIILGGKSRKAHIGHEVWRRRVKGFGETRLRRQEKEGLPLVW
jgi:hypothetical protein